MTKSSSHPIFGIFSIEELMVITGYSKTALYDYRSSSRDIPERTLSAFDKIVKNYRLIYKNGQMMDDINQIDHLVRMVIAVAGASEGQEDLHDALDELSSTVAKIKKKHKR